MNWYINMAWNTLNQAAGRGIRNSNDYCAVVFLNDRIDKNKLPKWMVKHGQLSLEVSI